VSKSNGAKKKPYRWDDDDDDDVGEEIRALLEQLLLLLWRKINLEAGSSSQTRRAMHKTVARRPSKKTALNWASSYEIARTRRE
jgi:hypothetical protein